MVLFGRSEGKVLFGGGVVDSDDVVVTLSGLVEHFLNGEERILHSIRIYQIEQS